MRDINIFETDMFPYLEGEEIKGEDLTLTIKDIRAEELPTSNGKREVKEVLYFSENKKGFVLNKTNCKIIAIMYGRKTGQWAGQKITLTTEEVQAFGQLHNALRVVPGPVQTQPVLEFPHNSPPIGKFFGEANDAGFGPDQAAQILKDAGFTNGYDPEQAPAMWAVITKAYEKAKAEQDGPMPQAMDEAVPGPVHSVHPMPGRVYSGDHKPSAMDEVEADEAQQPLIDVEVETELQTYE